MEEERKLPVRKRKVLEYLMQYDPELAKELLMEEDPESIIAKELSEWRIYKLSKLQEIDLPTLIASWSILRDMLKYALDIVKEGTESFFMRYMAMEQAMMEKMTPPEEEKRQGLLNLLTFLVTGFVDKLDKMMSSVGGGVSAKKEEPKEEVRWRVDIGGKAKADKRGSKRR